MKLNDLLKYSLFLGVGITPLFSQQVREINIWDQLTERVSQELGTNKNKVSIDCYECCSMDAVGEYVVISKGSGKSLMEYADNIVSQSDLTALQKNVLKNLVKSDFSFAGVTIIGDNIPNLLWSFANGMTLATSSGLKVLAQQVVANIQEAQINPETLDVNLPEFIQNGVHILKMSLMAFTASIKENISPDLINSYKNSYGIFQNNPVLQVGGGITTITHSGSPLTIYFNQMKAYNELFSLVSTGFDFEQALVALGGDQSYLNQLYAQGTAMTKAKLASLLKYGKAECVEDFILRAKYHGAGKSASELDYILGKTLADTIRAFSPADFGKLALPLQIINNQYATPSGADQSMDIITLVAELQL